MNSEPPNCPALPHFRTSGVLTGVSVSVRGVVGIALAAVLLAGCGTETVSGEAVGAAPSDAAGLPFDGCTDIPDEALVAAGVDPAKKIPDKDPEDPGWNICVVEGDGAYLMFAGTDLTMDEVRADSSNTRQRDVVVAGRPALEHQPGTSPIEKSCILAFDSATGVAMVRIERKVSNPERRDMCVPLAERAVHIVPYLPA